MSSERGRVILIHGMGRTAVSMVPLARALERAGYQAHRFGYASRTTTVAIAGAELVARLRELAAEDGSARIHLVGHSLGNILIRWAIHNEKPAQLGRVVMLAPPNRGSELADRLAHSWVAHVLRPLPELTTRSTSTARAIPPPAGVEFGVIAGDRDNKVRVAETHLEGEKDHIVVSSGHTFIMARPEVHRLVLRFLEAGAFT